MNRFTEKTYGDLAKCYTGECNDEIVTCENCPYVNQAIHKLSEYEDLEEQGRLAKLPCQVGTEVYRIVNKQFGRGDSKKFYRKIQKGKAQWEDYDKFGKTVFTSLEDAEKVLENG